MQYWSILKTLWSPIKNARFNVFLNLALNFTVLLTIIAICYKFKTHFCKQYFEVILQYVAVLKRSLNYIQTRTANDAALAHPIKWKEVETQIQLRSEKHLHRVKSFEYVSEITNANQIWLGYKLPHLTTHMPLAQAVWIQMRSSTFERMLK